MAAMLLSPTLLVLALVIVYPLISAIHQSLFRAESGLDADGYSVEAAWVLVDYFKRHAERLHALVGTDSRVQDARRILSWLRRHPDVTLFSRRHLYVSLHRSFRSPEALDRPLRLLADHHYLRPVPRSTAATGRPATMQYELNPNYSLQAQK